jgi:hypothetical protein
MSESTGLWSAATYFLSYDNDVATAETGAAIFKSIMQGESSGVEVSTVNTWYGNNNNSKQIEYLTNSICCFKHPLFLYQRDAVNKSFPIENSSLISSKELSMMLSLPRKSVPGLPVVDYATLAKEVVRYNDNNVRRLLPLGCIFDLGVEHVENRVGLDANSLTQHVFPDFVTFCGQKLAMSENQHISTRNRPSRVTQPRKIAIFASCSYAKRRIGQAQQVSWLLRSVPASLRNFIQ